MAALTRLLAVLAAASALRINPLKAVTKLRGAKAGGAKRVVRFPRPNFGFVSATRVRARRRPQSGRRPANTPTRLARTRGRAPQTQRAQKSARPPDHLLSDPRGGARSCSRRNGRSWARRRPGRPPGRLRVLRRVDTPVPKF